MSNLIWNKFTIDEQDQYIKYLKIFGALSGLFKDNHHGNNAQKPYLYYRNHEKIYFRAFSQYLKDLTRDDSAFDLIFHDDETGINQGIGLKTWLHIRNKTYQKVAEFNKLSPTQLKPLIDQNDSYALVRKVAELRNERVIFAKRLHDTTQDIYHFITRDDNLMNIVETKYDLIQLDNLKLVTENQGKVYTFTDNLRNYKFYNSKSVLLEEFDASQQEIIQSIPIQQSDDPFELLKTIQFSDEEELLVNQQVIFLPMYSDQNFNVEGKSGLNASLGAPKSGNYQRPEYEAYLPIPVWIHHVYQRFFGLNPFHARERKAHAGFSLIAPNGQKFRARITQEHGKSLQTNPQNDLGKWILKDVFNLQPYEKLTKEKLIETGVDSFKITKIGQKNFQIDLVGKMAFEKWKIENEDLIRSAQKQVNFRLPEFRPYLFEEDED